MADRVWSQVVLRHGVLALSHPDGRQGTHRFDPDLYELVASLNWHEYRGYARARIPNAGSTRLHWLSLGLNPGRGSTRHVDHRNGDTRDSRRDNLVDGTARQNAGNRNAQSDVGCGITGHRAGFKVQVTFAGSRPFQPWFRDLADATACRDQYMTMADEYDAGGPLPTRTELKTIADTIRNPKGTL